MQPDPPRELSSWKEVAAYLGVSVRTAQNWEIEKQLPVNRLGSARGRISVTTAELDDWKQSNLQPARRPPDQRFLRWYAISLTTALLIALVVFAVHVVRERGRRPAAYRIEPGRLVVLDASGRELWNALFPELADATSYASSEQAGFRRAWFGDLDGDSQTEMLFVPVLKPDSGSGRQPLICFSQDGAERWRFVPGRPVSTSTEKFERLFGVVNFAVAPLRRGGPNTVVAVSEHLMFYPAQVALLSSGGKLLREYWHSGHLPTVAVSDLDGDGNSEIYAAGVNNARKMATLVVLDPEHFGGAADERETPDYQIRGFPPGIEKSRILFPRTCLTNLHDVWNFASGLVLDARAMTVTINEDPHWTHAGVYYHFDRRLRLTNVVTGDGFTISHSRFRAEGRLDHDLNPAELERLRDITYATPVSGK
jgi:hypothetical protein